MKEPKAEIIEEYCGLFTLRYDDVYLSVTMWTKLAIIRPTRGCIKLRAYINDYRYQDILNTSITVKPNTIILESESNIYIIYELIQIPEEYEYQDKISDRTTQNDLREFIKRFKETANNFSRICPLIREFRERVKTDKKNNIWNVFGLNSWNKDHVLNNKRMKNKWDKF